MGLQVNEVWIRLMLTVTPIGSPLEYYLQRKQNVPQRTRPCLFLAEL